MSNAKKLALWFAGGGSVGILVATVVMYLARTHAIDHRVLFSIWPSSVVGIADPITIGDELLFGIVELGIQFALYGVIGLLIGSIRLRRSKAPALHVR
jgi:hypothetical protein